MSASYQVLPVHQHSHLMDECSEILNQQWPRSKAARNHSISKSTNSLPVSLAFVRQCEGKPDEVIGFSKISCVQGIDNAGLVESVVLRLIERGKGLGRILMNLTEDYGHKLGIKTLYLSTKDKEGFYTCLGYAKCQPVLSFGANAHRVPESMLHHFMTATSLSPLDSKVPEQTKNACSQMTSKTPNVGAKIEQPTIVPSSSLSPSPCPPPPPPPPPPPKAPESKSNSEIVTRLDSSGVTWMKKDLS